MDQNNEYKRRAMTSENARRVRQQGHDAEEEFANLIGGKTHGSGKKKDVIDKRGDIHSVKSGDKKWQIFLYRYQRLREDIDFQAAEILIKCLECFPESRQDYIENKNKYKAMLSKVMKSLKNYLNFGNNKKIFFKKAFLNNGEVDYLTIKENENFHVFDGNEVINILDRLTRVENSMAQRSGQVDEQKVIFKLISNGTTIGEIELRNDSNVHYKEIKFWMDREKTLRLLKEEMANTRVRYGKVIVHGRAISRFQELHD